MNQTPSPFKVLRAFDITQGSKPLIISAPSPDRVHFTNANGGLRSVNEEDIAQSAKSSAERLVTALAKEV